MPRDTRNMMQARLVAIAIFTFTVCVIAEVSDAQQSRQGGPQGGPPPEAISACESKSVGDACSMTLPGKGETVSGECISTPDQKVACMPEGAPRPPKS